MLPSDARKIRRDLDLQRGMSQGGGNDIVLSILG